MTATPSSLLDLLDPKFPLVYQGILPKDKHFQMTKARLSRECAICERPFSVFFWRIDGVPFKTLICQICAKTANVCQVSLFDLDFGIPVVVRNKLLHMQQEDYKSTARRWYNNRLQDRQIENNENWMDGSLRERILHLDPVTITRVQQVVASDPYLSFKKAPVCPQWLSNECTHGASCYFSHELPAPGTHSPDWTKFGIRGRYLGTVDPNGQAVIEKLLLIDQKIFTSNKEKENEEDEHEHENENKNEGVFNEGDVKKLEVKNPMTAPSLNRIFDYDMPLPYEGIEFDASTMPKFVNGKLQIQ
ncbi:hypothetical protein TRFO_34385 [Tritrichomonas foetus]|uniref:C3H1-type domain-containing protein n=1 Tax=Tritrichomonas foetus TaxID=1144522 RepID=A0A1J4JPL2_9EUKA|nr:hypothetical protein TRFO_34385 [Tritrichomonas foetus]|eukprot:OHS99204.1 hypothetical protein TRFO_34385 [Tritrichomonas foetus]